MPTVEHFHLNLLYTFINNARNSLHTQWKNFSISKRERNTFWVIETYFVYFVYAQNEIVFVIIILLIKFIHNGTTELTGSAIDCALQTQAVGNNVCLVTKLLFFLFNFLAEFRIYFYFSFLISIWARKFSIRQQPSQQQRAQPKEKKFSKTFHFMLFLLFRTILHQRIIYLIFSFLRLFIIFSRFCWCRLFSFHFNKCRSESTSSSCLAFVCLYYSRKPRSPNVYTKTINIFLLKTQFFFCFLLCV